MVGIVENPQSLLDEFALVLPGQVKSPSNVTVLFDAPGWRPARSASSALVCGPSAAAVQCVHPGLGGAEQPDQPRDSVPRVLTIGMLLIALIAVGGFTVLAQRRQRSLGMLASIGATRKNVSLVVRANGLVVGASGR